jgi:L-2,4-diaminobutyrate decarboxylase
VTAATALHAGPADAALAAAAEGGEALRELVTTALEALSEGVRRRGGPLPAGGPAAVAELVRAALDGPLLAEAGVGAPAALASLCGVLAEGAADPADARCAAHLHCPPLAVAVAADLVASAVNPSLDSWDQAPAATELEGHVVSALAALVGFAPEEAGGTLTSGGTASNLMGLLLARDAAVRRAFGLDPSLDGLPPGARDMRIFCSALAHFSVRRMAAVLGLGERAVVAVPVDRDRRMRVDALERALRREGRPAPMAIVATAGTTDFGSVDPLPEVADAARRHGAWLHVDAAYGGGALFSERLAPLLAGLAEADSVALDLHKLGWQPVAAGAFLVGRRDRLGGLERRVAYLNPSDDEAAGYPSLLGASLRTTRRADALKIAVTLRALGREGLGRLVDRCHDLAVHAAERVRAHPQLELTAGPTLTTVVFRYAARRAPDAVNGGLRRRLMEEGAAVVGRTEIDGAGAGGAVRLKLTLLNPHARPEDVDALLELVAHAGRREEAALAAAAPGREAR